MLWFIVGIFVIISVIMLTGKGGFLIAGYNTAGPEKKARYNEKKLSRVMGLGMSFVTVMLVVRGVIDDRMPPNYEFVFPVLIFVIIIGDIILANYVCKADENDQPAISQENIKKNYRTEIYTGIFTTVVLIIVAVIMFTGTVTSKVTDSKIVIQTSYYSDDKVSYDEIKSIEFRDSYKAGSKSSGFNSFKLDMGRFKNAEFNYYTIYVNKQCRSCIVIKTKDDVIVINQPTAAGTKKLYKEIKKKIGE